MDVNTFHDRDEQFNCIQCDFQGTSKLQIKKHIDVRHTRKNMNMGEIIECKYCGKQFKERANFMLHRKSEHPRTVAGCRNLSEGKCNFSEESCWWSHSKQQNIDSEGIECFICSESFGNRPDLMTHRKKEHPKIVQQCNLFRQNKCMFKNDLCWYSHDVKINNENIHEMEVESEDEVEIETEKEGEFMSVFRKTVRNPKPPLQKQQKRKQKME